MLKTGVFRFCVAIALLLLSVRAFSATIQFVATDLPDVVVGQDRWSYSYLLTGDFAAFEGFNLLFPSANYSDLDLTQAPDTSVWLSTLVQPDSGLGADGILTGTAAIDTSAVDLPFELAFTWLGSGNPSAQAFEIFDANFAVTETGVTEFACQPPGCAVPEPASVLLVASGLALMSRRRQRKSNS